MDTIAERIRPEASQRAVDKAGHYAFWLLLTVVGADAIFEFVPEQSTSTIYLLAGTGVFCVSLLVVGLIDSD
ncbi:hypothetical protein [Natronorubrum tibetense]|uniref:Uncharacterized protein n=1 Tax=Natronorubrum tibetense GA33 TaxID=1114856 RepID=L9VXG0_9EURY|nr:hypothetical protein [Natronorubrum tibetense]ELY41864.1 hypothetical protein C496_08716 [Natronorubrum tibetense GA33]